MNIIESNKLIAAFMGADMEHDAEYEMYGIIQDIQDGEDEKHFFTAEEMLFHSSYDWLMPVAEKIEQSGYDSVIEFSDFTYQCTFLDVSIGVTASTKIEAIYGAVIQFIQWYNKQKS